MAGLVDLCDPVLVGKPGRDSPSARTQAPSEPIRFWGVVTSISAALLGLGMLMANRTGLVAPYLEGQIGGDSLRPWLRSGAAALQWR